MRELERVVLLRVVDEYWMDHIDAMDDLRQGIGLRAYAQTDPVIAYKKEVSEMFEEMISAIQERDRPPAVLCPAAEGRGGQAGAGGQGHGGERGRRRHRARSSPVKVQEDRPQRPLPLRQRQEVQELLRPGCVKIPGQEDCHGIS